MLQFSASFGDLPRILTDQAIENTEDSNISRASGCTQDGWCGSDTTDCSTDQSTCSSDGCTQDGWCGSDTTDCSTDQSTCSSDGCRTDSPGCSTDSGTCTSDCSDCSDSPGGSRPTQTGSLQVTNMTSNSITVRLTSIARADYYTIAYREESWDYNEEATTSSLTYTISGLDPSTTYIVNYRGENDYGSGPYMLSGVRATTRAAVNPPTGKGRITLESRTADSLTINLASISGATGYTVVYRVEGTSDLEEIDTSSRTVTISGLTPNTTYVINYYGYNSGGTGPYMDTAFLATTSGLIDYWSWTSSNGSASSTQTRNAYTAVTSHGYTEDFSYLVWNDLVDKVQEILDAEGEGWSTMYASYSATRMTSSSKTLTATRFNALRQNIGAHVATGINEVSRGDRVYGDYFITLTDCINEWIDQL